MDFKRHFEMGWQNTLKFIGPVILLTFVQLIVTVITLGILGPVTTAGFMKSLLLAAKEGRTPDVKDLFSEMSLFLPLLGISIVLLIAITMGFALLVIPGFVVIFLVVFACLYLIPLMVDQRLGVLDALKGSWKMAMTKPLADQAIITIIYIAIMSVGGSIPFAILILQPLAIFIVLSVYEERMASLRQMQPPPPPPPSQ
jgi:hypothetical protein